VTCSTTTSPRIAGRAARVGLNQQLKREEAEALGHAAGISLIIISEADAQL
jgi:hypothetical protein